MQGGAPMAAPMDEIFPDEAVEAFAKLNLASAVSSYFKGSGRYMESDIAFRQAQRYRALGFHVVIARNQQRISDAMNGQGLAYHESVIKEIATARKSWDAKLLRELDAAVKVPSFQKALSRAREVYVDVLVDRDLGAEDAREVVGIWDRAAKLVVSKGLSGLIDEWVRATTNLRDLRMKPGLGREAASPLAAWKKWCIAGAIAVSIAAVVACFVWSSCAWVWAAVREAGGWCAECCLPSTGAATGTSGSGGAGRPAHGRVYER